MPGSVVEQAMLKPSLQALRAMPQLVQYLYYVVSAFRPVSQCKWQREGAPNPFVRRSWPTMREPLDARVIRDDLACLLDRACD